MAVLAYPIQTIDTTLWSSSSGSVALLSPQAYKTLATVVDPLLDQTITAPADAYTVS